MVDNYEMQCIRVNILQGLSAKSIRRRALGKRCICYGKSVHLSVCLSVRHTPVLCRNEGTQKDAVFIDGDDPVQVKTEYKEVDPQ